MIDRLINTMKQHGAAATGLRGANRWGVVQSVDPARPAVRVTVQPEGVLSGWLPIAQSAAGSGATVVSIPLPGMNALLVPDAADGEHYVVVGFAHSDLAPIPAPATTIGSGGTPSSAQVAWAAGESGIVGPHGAVLRMCANGDIYLRPGSGTLGIDGTLKVNGAITATEGITAGIGGSDSVTLQGHTHPQGPDSHGDAEQPTSSPTPGT